MTLSPRLWGIIAGSVLLLFAVWWIWGEFTSGQRAKVEARLNANQADAAAASGDDAVETVSSQAAVEDAVDAITKGNADAIHSAPGADAPVAAPVRDAGLAGLCKRASYRNDPKCLQHTATK